MPLLFRVQLRGKIAGCKYDIKCIASEVAYLFLGCFYGLTMQCVSINYIAFHLFTP